MTKNIDPQLVQQWNAMLDQELDANEHAKIEAALAASPENAAFMEGQRAFNQALKASFANTRAAKLPTPIATKFADFLKVEASASKSSPSHSTLAPQTSTHAPSLTLLKGGVSVGRVAAAALVLIALSVVGTLIASGQFDSSRGIQAPVAKAKLVARDEVLVASMKMMDTTNYADRELVNATYAKIGVDADRAAKLQAYGCGMNPISVQTVETKDGSSFTQLCYCTCNEIAQSGPNKGEPIRKRFVLNIVKGNVIPAEAKLDEMGCHTEHATGYHSFSKYHKDSDTTYVIIVPACFGNEDAEKLVEPLII